MSWGVMIITDPDTREYLGTPRGLSDEQINELLEKVQLHRQNCVTQERALRRERARRAGTLRRPQPSNVTELRRSP